MAARTNSSWAPRGPRSRSRPSLRMRFKCANRISIFLRSRRDCSKPSVPANDRATSRACSWMSRGILRCGSFGQHCGLSGHTSQSSLLARYRSVLPSCTVPLVPSCQRIAGQSSRRNARARGASIPRHALVPDVSLAAGDPSLHHLYVVRIDRHHIGVGSRGRAARADGRGPKISPDGPTQNAKRVRAKHPADERNYAPPSPVNAPAPPYASATLPKLQHTWPRRS